ncbi:MULTISPECIES: peptidase S10 [Paraburkholderia]|uniref:S10 family serine carboxypeptidase-like protein n=1 Tax=Paraburkholderia TaxID=1822464 RepID=UPI0022598D09|nr:MULTISPECIES: peptidase S10 [Paraburkholderia]MCX4161756.1 peptidase S10 [Paraburkholderia megapolitana]MDN7157253.1 peptidase S10 [Paraburkholderia sp. CHISQ3]MDQ6494298.1 peptidase S10 [Paraburkholderia megapolitana]
MQDTHDSQHPSLTGSSNIRQIQRHPRRLVTHIGLGVAALTAALALTGCNDDITTPADQPLVDNTAYSSKAGDGLAAAQVNEHAAVMHHQWSANGTAVNYTTTMGHLTASDPGGNAEASMSYVAYTAPSTDGSPRPVTFVYNGGPGSSSVWLRLGSFAPTRVATPDPLLTGWPNFPIVDNQESLIGTTDLVYIDPPGTGLSEAIQPNTNKTFWGTDPDVSVMRDFIRRYLTANNRASSPIYLYGESYGTPRTDMLALSLESAGVHLTGIVLQSSILNYMASTGDTSAGSIPSYAAVAAYFNQVSPSPTNLGAYTQQIQSFVTGQYAQIVQYSTANPQVVIDAATLASWSGQTGLTNAALSGYFQYYYDTEASPGQTVLVPGSTIGRYDGRVVLPNSDPRLASDNDPSDILINTPFTNALATQMPGYLGYTAPNATFSLLNDDIIGVWNFSHGGQPQPDTIPDLLAALTLNPQLKVLSENGYHDLATPYFETEKELARLQTVPGLNPNIQLTFYQGGHMIYLDNVARPKMQADLVSYYQNKPLAASLSLAQLSAPWTDEHPANTATTVAAMKATVKAAAR